MPFSRGRQCRAAVVGIAVALAGVTLTAPAHADTYRHADATGDVRWVTSQSMRAHRAHHNKTVDISHVTVRYTAKRVAFIVAFRSLSLRDLGDRVINATVRTSAHHTWALFSSHSHRGDAASFTYPARSPLKCSVRAGTNPQAGTMKMSFKSSCIDDPAWIRVYVSAEAGGLKWRKHFSDDALTDRRGMPHPAESPRIHR